MKGLILKDIFALKKQSRLIVIMMALYAVYSVMSKNIGMLSSMTVVICTMFLVSTMSYDEHCQWDRYALSAPVARKTVVLSKYVLAFMLDAAGFAVVAPLSAALAFFSGELSPQKALLVPAGVCAAALAIIAVILPILFKFGVEKGRLLIMLVFFACMLPPILWQKLGLPAPGGGQLNLLLAGTAALIALMVFFSYRLSVRIYAKKEF